MYHNILKTLVNCRNIKNLIYFHNIFMFLNILTTLCARIFRIYKTFQLSDNMSKMSKLSDNMNELYINHKQFSLSIGKKSKMYILYKK